MLKTVSSVANALGALNYKGTWNANTNTPALASGVGTKGDYYVVSVAGATNLDGITNWGVGDWATFNGSVWQRVEGGADGNFVNLDVTGTATFSSSVTALKGIFTQTGGDYAAVFTTPFDYVAKFISTDPAAFIVLQDSNSTDNYNRIGAVGNSIQIESGNVENAVFTSTASVFNENSVDMDFRVESDGNANMLFVDGGANNVGIGTVPSAGYVFHINAGASGKVKLAGDSAKLEFDNSGTFIQAGGNLNLTAASTLLLTAGSTNLMTATASAVTFNETGTDQDFRVESDTDANALVVDGGTGNVGVGSAGLTSTGPIATSAVGAAVTSFKSVCAAGDQTATNLILQSSRTDVYYHMQAFVSGSTEVFRIEASGNVKNTNNSYGALSDAKLKENIVDASPKLADLMQVKVRNYNLIGGTTKQIGVVAQELEAVFPSMVDENADRDEDGNLLETTTKGVKYSVFVPMLIKAIQEQQTLIESLTARITALES